MADNFAAGEMDAAGAMFPPPETMGARYNIQVAQPGRGEPAPPIEPYLVPPVHYVNGNMETVTPAIAHTPLGGMMPGPQQIAPPMEDMSSWVQRDAADATEFSQGVFDAWPEGSPVPFQVGRGAAQ